MKRISQKKLQEFILSIAVVRPLNIPGRNGMGYYSKIDGSYLTHVGMADNLKFLLRKGITEQIQSNNGNTACIGFNPEEQKWYGWSHRAIFGFGIGSTCKKGDCGYVAATPQELFDDVTKKDGDGWQWQKPEDVEIIKDGIRIKTEMVKLIGSDGSEGKTSKFISDSCDDILTADLEGNCLSIPSETEYWDRKCGRGEWTAKTLEDAYQMACDFAEEVG